MCIYSVYWDSVKHFHDTLTHIKSGLKWCTTAQKAIPFLQDVVKFVTLTPLYPLVTSLHQSSKLFVESGARDGESSCNENHLQFDSIINSGCFYLIISFQQTFKLLFDQ